jgi:hypothetical protein
VRDTAQLALLQGQGVTIQRDPWAEFAVLIGDPPVREVIDSDARLLLAMMMEERGQEIPATVSTSTILTGFFRDNEVPTGAIDGSNKLFTLAQTPDPADSLELYWNGLLQRRGIDYTLAASNIILPIPPIVGDDLVAFYRYQALVASGGNETPSGAINGVNVTFTLLAAPAPAASLELYQNGMLQRQGTEYTLSGNTITMTVAPITGDTLAAFYRLATSSVSYAENEVPTGLINGVNVTYTLANNPNPDASLCLYHNGILEINGVDYTLSGVTITMNVAPITGDTLVAFYRY